MTLAEFKEIIAAIPDEDNHLTVKASDGGVSWEVSSVTVEFSKKDDKFYVYVE